MRGLAVFFAHPYCEVCDMKKGTSKNKLKISAKDAPKFDVQRSDCKTFCFWDDGTLVLNVLGTPSAKIDSIGKAKGHQLKISVTAAPVSGRATDHMVKFLSQHFDVNTKAIEVVFGRMSVNKQLRIHAPKRLPAVIVKELSSQTKL